MSDDLNAKVGAETGDFKKGIAEINRDIRVLESSFRASAAGLQDWTKDATQMENRVKTLNAQIELQGQKVANTRAEYERLAAAEGAESKAAEDELVKLNKATEALNKMQLELRGTEDALKGMKDGTQDANKKTEESARNLQTLKNILGGAKTAVIDLGKATRATFGGLGAVVRGEVQIITGVMKASLVTIALFAAAIVGVGSIMLGLVFNAATTSDQLGELAEKTGLSTTRLQQMQFAGKILGTDLETITGSMAKMTRSMFSAKDGTGTQAKAFKELGVRVTDLKGNLRDQQDVFNDSIDALGKIENPALRDALAMEIFGKSAQELNPLIKATGKGLLQLYQEAGAVGAVLDSETIRAAGDLQDQLDGLKLGFSGVSTQIVAAFLPSISGVVGQVRGYLVDLVKIVRSSKGDFGVMAQGLTGLFTKISQDFAQELPTLARAGSQIVKSVLDAVIAALPQLIPAAQSILDIFVTFMTQNIPLLIPIGFQIINALITSISSMLPGLLDTGLVILKGVLAGIIAALPILVPLAGKLLGSLAGFLVQGLGALNDAAIPIISALVLELARNAPMLLGAAGQIIERLVTDLTTLVPQLLPAVVGILKGLVGFLGTELPIIATAAIQIIDALLEGILPLLPLLVGAAIKIVIALANGLTKALPKLTPVLVDAIIQIVKILADNAPLLIGAALALILALQQGFLASAPEINRAAPVIVKALVDALLASLPMIISAAGKLIGAFIGGIIANYPLIAAAGWKIVGVMLTALFSQKANLLNMGKDLVAGLWQGITDGWAAMLANFQDLVALLPDAIKTILGIHSHSKVGIWLGKNFSGGFGEGMLDELENVRKQMRVALGSFGPGLATAGGGQFTAGSQNSVNNDNFELKNLGIMNFIGQPTPKSLASQAKARRF